MAIERRPETGAFWLQWVLATTLGETVALLPPAVAAMPFAAAAMSFGPDAKGMGAAFLFVLVITVLSAVLVGVAQWLVLRQHLPRAGGWFWATTAGILGGLFVAWPLVVTVSASLGPGVRIIAGPAAFGAMVGGLQWLVLRDRVPDAGWWVAASAGGFALGFGISQAMVGTTMGWNSIPRMMASGVAVWATYGAVTGGVLAWLLIRAWDSRW